MAVAPAPPHFPLPPGHALTATSTASRSQASDVALMVATALRDDGRHTLSFSRRDFGLSFAYSLAHLRREGAGKAGRRLRPQATVCNGRKNAHGFDRYSRDIPAFPAQWLYGLYVLSPVSGLFCHRRQLGLTTRLDARVAASGPHDFAVRCGRFVRGKDHLTPQRPSQPAPTFRDDREASPLVGTGWAEYCH